MRKSGYLMEHGDESLRLETKTDRATLNKQALWAGISQGMQVADVGCGSGITASYLHDLVEPGGSVVGMDASEKRIIHARGNYGSDSVRFKQTDMLAPMENVEEFDFVWVRFFLEYFRTDAIALARNISGLVKPGGILCLIDLDYNCLNHFGMSPKLERTMFDIIHTLEEKADFDPYVGRKLYSFLYDMGYTDIDVHISAHHLIFGDLSESDEFNWLKKVEVAPRKIGYAFPEYTGGYEEFLEDFRNFFNDPRRFTYSPIICCRGRKPL
jgi:ubiquinone/menaquinone biosynthesis C-methylase UbiE